VERDHGREGAQDRPRYRTSLPALEGLVPAVGKFLRTQKFRVVLDSGHDACNQGSRKTNASLMAS
jgi:hypothetical protein